MDDNNRIIEINGVKMEVDLREAKKVDNYRVGDNVKVLKKEYQEYKSHIGTIIGFDNFEETPTIVIAYLKKSYSEASIDFVYYNDKTQDVEIAPLNDYDLPLKKSTVLDQFDKQITKKEEEVKELKHQKEMFESLFGKYFEQKVQVTE